jgi:hypothetical protein
MIPPCLPLNSFWGAGLEEPLNLFVHTSDRLNLTRLIDGSGDSQPLMDRQIGEAGENGGKLSHHSAIAFYFGIGLFERRRGAHGEEMGAGTFSGEISGQRHDAFVVDRPGQFRFSLNIDDAFSADIRASCDARGTPERIVTELMGREALDLADDVAVQIHHRAPSLISPWIQCSVTL